MWSGYVDTRSVAFMWWGPPEQVDWNWQNYLDYYKVYRDEILIYGDGVGGAPKAGGVTPNPRFGHPSPYFVDVGLASNSSHRYHVTAVKSGRESTPSPSVTMTTLANETPVAPTPPTDPATWIQPYSLPVGGTLWTATVTTPGGWNTAGTGRNNATNCGFLYALEHANKDGGDVIVLTAGAIYPTPGSGWQIPAFTGTNGWTYIISSEDPGYKAGGALPAYTYTSTNVGFNVYNCVGTIRKGVTSATLQNPWSLKSGAYYVVFSDQEERLVTFNNGKQSIEWGTLNTAYGAPPGLSGDVTGTIQVAYQNCVTPADIATAMPTLLYGNAASNGILIPAACAKVRFVGINIKPVPPPPSPAGAGIIFQWSTPDNFQASAESIYIDRCVIGQEALSAGFNWTRDGIMGINCNHLLVHQCYVWGMMQGSGGETHGIYGLGGGPWCVQNSYVEASSINFFTGGANVDRNQVPHDVVYRYNFNHKPCAWCVGISYPPNPETPYGKIGYAIKNLYEQKVGVRFEAYGNLMLNCWTGTVQGYHGAAFGLGSRDQQNLARAAINFRMTCPWVRITDVNIHDNQIYNVQTGFVSFTSDNSPAGFDARCRFVNNIVFINPINPPSDRMYAVRLSGPCVDHIIDHNTFITNMTLNVGAAGFPMGFVNYNFGTAAGGYRNPMPFTPNAYSNWQDRLTITNNIIDGGGRAPAAFATMDGAPALRSPPYNSLNWSKNLTINDNTTYAGDTYNGVPYASIGFANWRGNTVIPLRPSDWNVTSGKYAKASATGGPIGAIF